MRHRHGHERRPNLTVSNGVDRYWAYCNACKAGAIVMKEHVVVSGARAPANSASLSVPPDMIKVIDADKHTSNGVLGYLASKGMDAQYLPEIWFSAERKRILLQHENQWLGRDVTDSSPQKWLTYNRTVFLSGRLPASKARSAVLVEDPFSFFKVDYAVRGTELGVECDVYSSLGTRIHDELMVKLLSYDRAIMFYDGDKAGLDGGSTGASRLRSMGVHASTALAPKGLDPKDMTCEEIVQHLRWAL